MKNKIKIGLFALIITGVITLCLTYKSKKVNTIKKSNLAIMIDETSDGSYASSNSVPKGSYFLNEEKTFCENGGKVKSYNNSTGQIGFSFLGSDRCSLYFDRVEKPTITNVSLNGSNLSASFNSKKSLCCYAITTSDSEPTDWTNISGSSYNLNTSLATSGTYYLWLKDSYGNITKYDDSIIVKNYKGYETILINNGNGAATVEDAKRYIVGKGTPDFKKVSTTNDGMYATEDDLGTSYYFRGAIDNNWLQFGKDESNNNMYWRIIRINGDNSIRMIYSGVTPPDSSSAVVMTGTGTQINESTYTYNDNANNPAYVGYMYTLNAQHGYGKSSGVKTTLDNWYKTTTLETDAKTKSLIADQIFCDDRSASTSDDGPYGEISGSLSASSTYYYGPYYRVVSTKIPSLNCESVNDRFTVNTSNGNGALTYPVGLLSADEVMLAGGQNTTDNNAFYLYTNQGFWLLAPVRYYSSKSLVWKIDVGGSYVGTNVGSHNGIRPVINLSKDVKLSGDGTWNNIYKVEE